MPRIPTILIALPAACLLAVGCTKEPANPFDPFAEEEAVDNGEIQLDPTSLAGLHANIFGKTCANAGCHDGTFEPDFRTIGSTYNTLVNHPVIKNDPQGSFTYRVVPGDAGRSLLIARLTYDIDGNSGVMPLVVEPGSDWYEKKDEYIDHIKTWINEGAKEN